MAEWYFPFVAGLVLGAIIAFAWVELAERR